MSRKYVTETIMTAKATTGIGSAKPVSDLMHMAFQLSSQTSANFTIKFQGSLAETMPDFAAAATATNPWAYISIKDDTLDGTVIAGATGLAYTGTDLVKIIELIPTGLTWVNAVITAISAGSVNVKFGGFSNE